MRQVLTIFLTYTIYLFKQRVNGQTLERAAQHSKAIEGKRWPSKAANGIGGLTQASVDPRYPRFNPSLYSSFCTAVRSVNSAVNMAELASDVASFVFLLPLSSLRGFAVFLFRGGCGIQGGFEVKKRSITGRGKTSRYPRKIFFLFFFFAVSRSFDLTRYFIRMLRSFRGEVLDDRETMLRGDIFIYS